jgi:hypothetical protein
MNWIDVNNRLPREPGKVIVSLGDDVVTGVFNGKYFFVLTIDDNGMGFNKVAEVTHWMPRPLPPLPEDEDWNSEAMSIVLEVAMESGRSHVSGEKPPSFYMLPERVFNKAHALATKVYMRDRHGIIT